MHRNLRVAVFALLLAAVAGGGYLLWRPSGGPTGDTLGAGDRDGGVAPGAVAGHGTAGGAAADPTAKPVEGALAAGGRRPERVGKGSITARVARVKGQTVLAGATVVVTGTGYGGEPVDLRATTDAKGVVAFDAVPTGNGYTVRVDAGKDGVVTRPDVEVRAGRATDTGTILVGATVAIEGRVVDEKGAGLANADVRVFVGFDNPMEMIANMFEMFANMGHEATPLAKTTTATDGSFRLTDVSPGTLVVRAIAPGRHMATARVNAAGETPPPPVRITLEPGADVAGVVVDERGAPVAGASVALMNDGGNGDEMMDWMTRRVFATTDAAGRFSAVVEVGSKSWRAIVESPGYPTTIGPAFAAGATDVRIVLERGADVEVTLLDERGDAPIAGATIALGVGNLGGSADTEAGVMPSAVTDPAGVARIAAKPGKVQMLMIMVPGRDFMMVSPEARVPLGQGVVGDVPKTLAAGPNPTKVTLRVKAGIVVTGTVRGTGGAPIEGVEVRSISMFSKGAEAIRTDAEGGYRIAVSSMFGQAMAILSFRAPGYVAESAQLTIDQAAQTSGTMTHDVRLRAGAVVAGRVVDPEGKPVVGAAITIEGGGGGLDLAGMLGGSGAKYVTAADGTYRLVDVAPSDAGRNEDGTEPKVAFAARGASDTDATSTVRVAAEGFVVARSAPIRIAEGAKVDVPPLRLSRGATVRGTVRGADGRAAARAKVELSVVSKDAKQPRFTVAINGVTWEGQRSLTADDQGRFEATALEVGTVTLTVTAPGSAATRKTFDLVGESDVATPTIDLRPGHALEGVVLDGTGQPVRGGRVSIDGTLVGREGDDGYVAPQSVASRSDGRFTLADVPAGSVPLVVYAAGFEPGHAVAATGAAVEVRLAPEPADKRARVAAIEQEVAALSQRFATVRDTAEREALQKRLVDLIQEKQRLEGADPGATTPPSVDGEK